MRALTLSDPALVGSLVSPTPPTPASPVAVWWAGDLALSDGAGVSSWVDRVNSVTVVQATSGNQPVFDADGANGRPSVNFDGSNDYLGLASSLSSALAGCVVAVVQITDPLQGQSVWANSVGSSPSRYLIGVTRYSTGGEVESQQRNNDTDDVVRGSTAVTAATLAALEWSSSGTAYAHRLNNATQAMTAFAGSNNGDWFGDVSSPDRWRIGALAYNNTHTSYLAGRVAYLGVFSAQLSSGDRSALYGWLKSHYGLTGITV